MSMTSGWNYRLIKQKIDGYDSIGIYEVFYSPRAHKPFMWSQDAVNALVFSGGDVKILKPHMKMMMQAFERPILEVRGKKLIEVKS